MNLAPFATRRRRALCGALVCASAAASVDAAWAASEIYTCVGGSGRKLTSDRMIAECMDREQRVLSRDGTLLRIVPPTLTADERAARDAQERQLVAAKQGRDEAARRDRNLLQRYPNPDSHQKARESALEDLRTSMKLSELRRRELAQERKPLLDEAEFYKGKPLPPKLYQQLDANEAATAAQRDAQQNQKAELDRVNKLFDAELARLKRLWAGAAPGSVGAAVEEAASTTAPAKPAAKRGQ